MAVFFAPGAQPARAQDTTVWSATLTVQDFFGNLGCADSVANTALCSLTSVLTDDDFTYFDVDYAVTKITLFSGGLIVIFDKAPPSDLVLNVDGTGFSVGRGSRSNEDKTVAWANTGLNWTAGNTVSLSLTGYSTTNPAPDNDGVTTYWSDTLTAKAVDYGFGCGFRTGQPQCDARFRYHGVLHEIELVHVAYGDTLQLILSGVPSAPNDGDGSGTERSRMALNVETTVGTTMVNKQFLVKDAMVSYGALGKPNAWVLTWTGSGLSWSENAEIPLSLVTLPAGGL